MSIRKVGNRWQVRVRRGRGRPRFEQTLPPTATHKDARELETQVRKAQIDTALGRKPQRLLDEAVDRWEKSARRMKSWPKEKYRVDVLREYTAGRSLDDLPAVAERVKEVGLETGLSAAGINRYLGFLRRVGNLAEKWGWTDMPLGRRVELLPENSERHVYLTEAAVRGMLAKADPLLADMIRFAVLTGIRKGELLNLKPAQVTKRLLVLGTDTKNGRPRGIPIPPEAARIAKARLPWGIGQQQHRARWERLRVAVGLPGVRWHDLRHTYASWLVQAGKPLPAVRDLLGHSSLSVTNRYAHLAPAHLQDAITALPSLSGGENAGKKRRQNGRKKAA
jgi:integrase